MVLRLLEESERSILFTQQLFARCQLCADTMWMELNFFEQEERRSKQKDCIQSRVNKLPVNEKGLIFATYTLPGSWDSYQVYFKFYCFVCFILTWETKWWKTLVSEMLMCLSILGARRKLCWIVDAAVLLEPQSSHFCSLCFFFYLGMEIKWYQKKRKWERALESM